MPDQLELWPQPSSSPDPPRSESDRAEMLRTLLSNQTGLTIHLTLTNNRSRMMSYRVVERGHIRLRLHAMFLDAPDEVQHAVASWIKKPKSLGAIPSLDAFVRGLDAGAPALAAKPPTLEAVGELWDLRTVFDALNAEYFENKVTAQIGWGRMPTNRGRRRIRLGSYALEQNTIRIHPLLDQRFVPRYFLEYVVFHEMAHAFVGIGKRENGRRVIHSREFYAQEKRFAQYDQAMAWIAEPRNLARLLRKQRPPRHGTA